ncbi:MAG: DedA family protein [Cyanobacteria bacterium P01_A01_bin.105]
MDALPTDLFSAEFFSSGLFSLENLQSLARTYGYWAVFLGIMLESTGLPIPGETMTLVGGFLAGSDELVYRWVLGSAIAGAAVGDSLGYWVGFFGGWPLMLRLSQLFNIEEDNVLKLREQFSQNAGKAVVLGRFVALLRIFAGPLAGIAQMPYWKFLLCNLLGATLWGTTMVTLAYGVGHLIPLATLVQWVAQFTVATLAIVIGWITLQLWKNTRTPAAPSQDPCSTGRS